MMAAGLQPTDSTETIETMARQAALWWHGQTESDVPKT
jgi:hypothetical protein